ncbi:Ger(x)C family spore germination C-terminal domain-containing protein [Bacillus sp. AFS002410]|uniref:Ger(x)C family spore germination C-terminal domain-containing protein n=1 Tax=Bacillus sp. AFS002410 TaxID=2033481 RepID=UPI0035A0BC32
MKGIKNKIKPNVKGNKISFDVYIESEGRIAKYWNPKLRSAFKEKNVKRVETAPSNKRINVF